jgi:hypothetical protein
MVRVLLVGLTACVAGEPIESLDEAELIAPDDPCLWQSCEGEQLVSPAPVELASVLPAPNKRKLRACLNACEGGADAIAAFCRSLRHPIIKGVCWGYVLAGNPLAKAFATGITHDDNNTHWYYT